MILGSCTISAFAQGSGQGREGLPMWCEILTNRGCQIAWKTPSPVSSTINAQTLNIWAKVVVGMAMASCMTCALLACIHSCNEGNICIAWVRFSFLRGTRKISGARGRETSHKSHSKPIVTILLLNCPFSHYILFSLYILQVAVPILSLLQDMVHNRWCILCQWPPGAQNFLTALTQNQIQHIHPSCVQTHHECGKPEVTF